MIRALIIKLRTSIIVLLTLILYSAPYDIQGQTQFPKATVIIDPADKQKIMGNTTIAMAWGRQIIPPKNYHRALINLTNAMNTWTEVYTTGYNHLNLASELLLDVPFIIITTGDDFVLTHFERKRVKEYFENGGFLFCDNALATSRNSPAEKSFRRMIRETLGEKAEIKPLPDEHDIFHCFFDFEDGAPVMFSGRLINSVPFDGVWYNDRLVAVYSNRGYIKRWNDTKGNILQLKMGVNMVIFALTRDDSIAKRE